MTRCRICAPDACPARLYSSLRRDDAGAGEERRYTRIVARVRTRILGALLIVLLGTAQSIAAVCESFCPAHEEAAVEVVSHHGPHHAHPPADEVAPEPGPRIAMPGTACCPFPDAPAPTLTTNRGSSSRESIAAASIGTPSFSPTLAALPLNVDVGLPPRQSSRLPALLTLRI
jgi:hypothetical protein